MRTNRRVYIGTEERIVLTVLRLARTIAYFRVHSFAVAIACFSFFFHTSATSCRLLESNKTPQTVRRILAQKQYKRIIEYIEMQKQVSSMLIAMQTVQIWGHRLDRTLARGSSGFGEASSSCSDRHSVRTCSAGDHLSLRMSRQMRPRRSMLGLMEQREGKQTRKCTHERRAREIEIEAEIYVDG